MPQILNKKMVEDIPKLLKTMSIQEVADNYKVHNRTIHRWIRVLRAKGYIIIQKKGYKALI